MKFKCPHCEGELEIKTKKVEVDQYVCIPGEDTEKDVVDEDVTGSFDTLIEKRFSKSN